MNTVTFTHLITNKKVTIFNPLTSIAAVFTAPVDHGKKPAYDATWIVVNQVPNPIPVQETEDQVKTALGL